MSTKFNNPTISDVIKVNKIVKRLKLSTAFIKIPQMNLKSLYIKLFTDASFNNLPNGGSQAGQIIFLSDNQKSCPLFWNSSRIKRVARSTITSETLSLSDGCDTAMFIKALVSETIEINAQSSIKINAYIDNQSLHDLLHNTKHALEKRLVLDISSLREMIDRKEVTVTWVDNKKQLSDVLTKAGSPPSVLLDIAQSAKIPFIHKKKKKKTKKKMKL